jgi:serine/threonine protein kinase
MMSVEGSKNKIFVHRDIKSENVLVHKDVNGNEIFKIADFGFSRSISN